ncbi:hypothetical protein DPMN_146639 [Dreissena polymorpha]|uniref:Uncharacterized protein n=1 Tax=Dreissena polymorpha TaxID=45954 RepID=A0A9D4F678_DREPO|nr:hypothetical protein DPMN_146639 [Dreissena polymorpha]
MRAVLTFPDYKITSNSEYQKRKKRILLNAALKLSELVNWVFRVYVYVPDESSHNHVIGELGSANQRLDQAIIDQIHMLHVVSDLARRTDEVERAVNSFVQRQFPTASRLNPRYYPS